MTIWAPLRFVTSFLSQQTTRMSPSHSQPAPWRELFLEHVNSMPQATFVLSTLHPVPGSQSEPAASPSSALAVVPRARTCICRGLWGTLPANEKNPAPRNPPVWESDLPVLTTDARMEKAAEVMDTASTAGQTTGTRGGRASGGGGPVEAVWYAETAMTQWRLRGTAWLLGPDVGGEEGSSARNAILSKMRRRAKTTTGEGETEWSWSREVTAHFGNLSPVMRGTFRSPAPGTPVASPPEDGLGLGQRVDDLEDKVARSNFRVVVIVPSEVDQVDLSDQLRPRRWKYTYRGPSCLPQHPGGEAIGEWEKVEVWP